MNIDLNNKKNKKEKDKFSWFMLFLIFFVGVATGIYRDGFSVLFPLLQEDFGLTRAQLGLHSTFFFLGNAFAALFTGRLVDLKGSKWGLIYGVFTMGFLCILHSIAPNFLILLLLGVLTGIAVSINLPSSTRGIIENFPKKWRGTAFGMQSTGFPVGGMAGAILLSLLGVSLGWRKTIIIPGLIAFICVFAIICFYKDKKFKNISTDSKDETSNISLLKSYRKLFKNRELVSFSVFGFFLGAVSGSISNHFTIFLYLDYDLSASVAGLGFAIVQLGSVFGRLGWGITCDKLLNFNKRKTFLYLGISFTLVSLMLGMFFKNISPPIIILFVLAFLIGYSGRGWQGLYLASVSDMVEDKYNGIAIGFSSVLFRIGLMVAPPIFGFIADIRGSYDISWILLGFILLITSVAQYLIYAK